MVDEATMTGTTTTTTTTPKSSPTQNESSSSSSLSQQSKRRMSHNNQIIQDAIAVREETEELQDNTSNCGEGSTTDPSENGEMV